MMSNISYHLTRDPWRISKDEPPTICGTTADFVGPDLTFTYRLNWYYSDPDMLHDSGYVWCPKCVDLLTPLDELKHTEL